MQLTAFWMNILKTVNKYFIEPSLEASYSCMSSGVRLYSMRLPPTCWESSFRQALPSPKDSKALLTVTVRFMVTIFTWQAEWTVEPYVTGWVPFWTMTGQFRPPSNLRNISTISNWRRDDGLHNNCQWSVLTRDFSFLLLINLLNYLKIIEDVF